MHFLILLRSGLIILFAIFALYVFLTTVLVIPIWAFNRCNLLRRMVKGSKNCLGRRIACFWSLGEIAYGAFMARSRPCGNKPCSWPWMLLVAAGYPFIQNYLAKLRTTRLTLAIQDISKARLGDLTEPQRAEMEQNCIPWKMKRRAPGMITAGEERLDESITLAEDLVAGGYSIESHGTIGITISLTVSPLITSN